MKKILLWILSIMLLCMTLPFNTQTVNAVEDMGTVIEKLTSFELIEGYQNNIEFLSQLVSKDEFNKALYQMGGIENAAEYAIGENVSYQEMIRGFITILGYHEYAVIRGGDLSVAAEIGLLKNSDKIDGLQYVDRATFLKYCERVLEDVAILQQSVVGASNKFESNKGETLLKKKFDIVKSSGVVTANELTTLNLPESNLATHQILIDGQVYYVPDYDTTKLLGYRVEYYYKDTQENVRDILYLYVSDKNKDINIPSYDIISSDNGVFTYLNEDKVERISISAAATVIYNDIARPKYQDSDLFSKNGSVNMIDNDKDGKYDVIKVNVYDTYVVDRIDIHGKIIYDKYGKQPLKLDDDVNYMMTFGKTEISVDNLEEWDVLEVGSDAMTLKNGKPIVDQTASTRYRIVAFNNKVLGRMTEYSEDKCKIEDTEFRIDGAVLGDRVTQSMKNGENGIFLLGVNDKIVGVYFENELAVKYGYLYNISKKGDLSESISFEIFTEDGKVEIFESKNKIQFKDENIKSSALFDKFSGTLVNNNKAVNQLIQYKAVAGIITSVNAYQDMSGVKNYIGYTKDVFTRDFAAATSIYRGFNQRLFSGKYQLNADSKIFCIPLNDSGNPIKDLARMEKLSFFVENTTYKNVEIYDATKERSITVLVMKTKGTELLTDTSPVVVVDNLSGAVLPDGAIGYKLNGYVNGVKTGLLVDNSSIRDKNGWGKGTKSLAELKKGDVVQYALNVKNYIADFRVLFSPQTDFSFGEKIVGGGLDEYSYYGTMYTGVGKIVEVNDTSIIFNGHIGDSGETPLENPLWNRTVIDGGAKILKYDMQKDKLTLIERSELFENYNVFIRTINTYTKEIILYIR